VHLISQSECANNKITIDFYKHSGASERYETNNHYFLFVFIQRCRDIVGILNACKKEKHLHLQVFLNEIIINL
jgi:hypothetical protein